MSVVYLNEFQEEITSYVEQLKSNGSVRFDGPYERMKEEAETSFKEQLLHNICSGNTFLKSGGLGLEALILELIELEGYKGKITYKAKYENHADTDIEASRTDPLSSNRVYIQVKNHKGHTDDWGIKQLIAVEEDEHVDRWMITSGQISEQVRAYAENVGVFVMDGVGLVDWIYARANELSDSTIKKLGISLIPQILI
jgi:restriction system protein